MFKIISGQSADEVWLKIAKNFRDNRSPKSHTSRGGAVRDEFLRTAITVADPRQRWVVSRAPAINPAFAIADLVWIVRGRNNSAFLNYFNSELPKYAGKGKTYHGAYGYRIRKHLGIDQLDRAYRALKRNQDSRQVVLQIWDSRIDFPDNAGKEVSKDIPCNIVSLLKVRNGRLEWTQIMRSNDVFRGLPYNFVQFMGLQEILAGWLNLKPGAYHHFSDSLHLYTDSAAKVRAARFIAHDANSDSIALDRKDSDKAFLKLEQCIKKIIEPRYSVAGIQCLPERVSLPVPFRNMLCIIVAEGLRRRKAGDAGDIIMATCTNPLYRQLWKHWRATCQANKKRKALESGR
jgi:thymidylate synthase